MGGAEVLLESVFPMRGCNCMIGNSRKKRTICLKGAFHGKLNAASVSGYCRIQALNVALLSSAHCQNKEEI